MALGSRKRKCLEFISKYLSAIKMFCMIAAFVIAFYFQGKWHKQTNIYHTDDPLDTVRKGVKYHCGCSLPGPLQTAQNSKIVENSNASSTWNTCYASSLLETVTMLMYPNFTGVNELERILSDTHSGKIQTLPSTKVVPGVSGTVQAHDVANIGPAFPDYVSRLNPGGYINQTGVVNVSDLLNGQAFWDFPESRLTLTFAYTCNDCSFCNLSALNDIFTNISVADTKSSRYRWGQCVQWGTTDSCHPDGKYSGKCAVYPGIAVVPLVFGIQKFLQEFFALEGISYVYPTSTHDPGPSGFYSNYTSLKSSEVYMNLRQDIPSMVQLSFLEIERGSPVWLLLLDRYPTLGTECSMVKNVTSYNGNLVCNLHKNAATAKFEYKCLKMSFRDKYECEDIFGDMTVDNAPPAVFEMFNASDKYWLSLLCRLHQSREIIPPYKMLTQTAPVMHDDILNGFLESQILTNEWARDSGVCTSTYENVIRYVPKGSTNKSAKFMEANCSQSSYCWLTGRYREFTQTPQDDWLEMNASSPASARSKDTFVCYNVADVPFVEWFIVTFGIIFGWLGTVDLLFKWIERWLRRCLEERTHQDWVSTGTETPEVQRPGTGYLPQLTIPEAQNAEDELTGAPPAAELEFTPLGDRGELSSLDEPRDASNLNQNPQASPLQNTNVMHESVLGSILRRSISGASYFRLRTV